MAEDWKCPEDRFPIMGGESYGRRHLTVPLAIVAEHERQARQNHGQTVARLKDRGGLSWCDLFAVLHDRDWWRLDLDVAHEACMRFILFWQDKKRREREAAKAPAAPPSEDQGPS